MVGVRDVLEEFFEFSTVAGTVPAELFPRHLAPSFLPTTASIALLHWKVSLVGNWSVQPISVFSHQARIAASTTTEMAVAPTTRGAQTVAWA